MTSLIQDIKAMEEGGFSIEEISNFKKNKIFEMVNNLLKILVF
jgi:hypothetical protein